MRILETLVPVGFVVVMIICFLQGRHEAQRPKRPGRTRNRPSVLPVASMTAFRGDDGPGSTGQSADPLLTAEIPRDWMETALHRPEWEAQQHSMAWPDEGHLMGSLVADHHESVNGMDPFHGFGLINPANGLPMFGDGPMDIVGNRFGENGRQDNWSSHGDDSGSMDFTSSSSSMSSWDDG